MAGSIPNIFRYLRKRTLLHFEMGRGPFSFCLEIYFHKNARIWAFYQGENNIKRKFRKNLKNVLTKPFLCNIIILASQNEEYNTAV